MSDEKNYTYSAMNKTMTCTFREAYEKALNLGLDMPVWVICKERYQCMCSDCISAEREDSKLQLQIKELERVVGISFDDKDFVLTVARWKNAYYTE